MFSLRVSTVGGFCCLKRKGSTVVCLSPVLEPTLVTTLTMTVRPAILGGGQLRVRMAKSAVEISIRAFLLKYNIQKVGAIRTKFF